MDACNSHFAAYIGHVRGWDVLQDSPSTLATSKTALQYLANLHFYVHSQQRETRNLQAVGSTF